MKGKGKQQMTECPLSYPDFKPVDHVKECPSYTEVLRLTLATSSLSYDVLAGLKNDLDLLLKSVSRRMETLVEETDKLTVWIENKKEKKLLDSLEGADPMPSRQASEEKPFKNLRDTPARVCDSPSVTASKPKSKQTKTQSGMASLESALGRVPKSDAPEKFWAMVEPYCADITTEDLKTLEDLLRSHDDDIEYYKIPSLGKHYSLRWAAEDMAEEKKDSQKLKKSPHKRQLGNAGNGSSSSENAAPVNPEPEPMQQPEPVDLADQEQEESPFGPLTQRLVSALIEESIMAPVDDESIKEITGSSTDPGEKICNITPRDLAKQLNVSNTRYLEKRIRRELEEQGILQSEDVMDCEEGDEILAELKQKQEELRTIGQHNLTLTKKLYRLAKEEMSRQDLRRKLAAVDADVMEAYRGIQAARQKKRPPTRREKDIVMKALKERDALVKQIEAYGQ